MNHWVVQVKDKYQTITESCINPYGCEWDL